LTRAGTSMRTTITKDDKGAEGGNDVDEGKDDKI
jgi:hypothetical protein